MNFNFQDNPEYNLNTTLIEEVIRLYGVLTKFLITDKINRDDVVFGDYSHIKSDATKIYDVYMLPEVSEDWDTGGEFGFNPFGLTNFENINLFMAASEMDIMNLTNEHVTGNLVVLPNNKIMEITNTSWETPGVNNIFTSANAKSVLKLTCKPYDFKLINELDNVDISVAPDNAPYDTLDTYFQELIDSGTAQDTEAEVTPSVTTVTKTGGIDTTVDKPIVDNSEDDIWGNF